MTKVIGKAYLVGAGPGRADLITRKGLRLLQEAEVVLYDRLIDEALLEEVRPNAIAIFVGKESGLHAQPQREINQLLIDFVRQGKHVVRLKGGDPFLFGRGGEEALALAEQGLPFEIVPGVTSAVAVPALAGIPLTHKEIADGFGIVAGYESAEKLNTDTDWSALAKLPTLVILMGIARIQEIVDRLLKEGKSADTPAAIIANGSRPNQQVVRGTMIQLPTLIETEKINSPAVIVIGRVAELQIFSS